MLDNDLISVDTQERLVGIGPNNAADIYLLDMVYYYYYCCRCYLFYLPIILHPIITLQWRRVTDSLSRNNEKTSIRTALYKVYIEAGSRMLVTA